VIFEDQIFSVEAFSRNPMKESKAKLTAEELAIKRSEWGKMGRKASPFG